MPGPPSSQSSAYSLSIVDALKDTDKPSQAAQAEDLNTFASASASAASVDDAKHDVGARQQPKRGIKFWMCILSLMLCAFLMALDLVSQKYNEKYLALSTHLQLTRVAHPRHFLSSSTTSTAPNSNGLVPHIPSQPRL